MTKAPTRGRSPMRRLTLVDADFTKGAWCAETPMNYFLYRISAVLREGYGGQDPDVEIVIRAIEELLPESP